MKIVEFKAPFAWSEKGWDVLEFAEGDIAEVSDACANAAIEAGKAAELDAAALQAATEAHTKLLAKADKAEADAAAAEEAARKAWAKAADARATAKSARISRQTEALAADEAEAA